MLIKKIDGDYNNAVGFPAQVRPGCRAEKRMRKLIRPLF